MASTERNDTRRALLLARIAKSWDKRPDLSFGELIDKALDSIARDRLRAVGLHGMNDEEIARAVERFVLLDPTPSSKPPEGV